MVKVGSYEADSSKNRLEILPQTPPNNPTLLPNVRFGVYPYMDTLNNMFSEEKVRKGLQASTNSP